MSDSLSGGCGCGAVRYRLGSPPYDCGWCHCRICQLSSAAPALVFATVPRSDFLMETGADRIRTFLSTNFGERHFCGECGTLLTMQVAHQPETIDFTVATLDDPGAIEPAFHIFFGSAIAWFDPSDGLPRHDRFRPETRGLDGTEPPA